MMTSSDQRYMYDKWAVRQWNQATAQYLTLLFQLTCRWSPCHIHPSTNDFHATSGTNNPSFSAAVNELQSRAGSAPLPAVDKDTPPLVIVQDALVLSAAPDSRTKPPHSGRRLDNTYLRFTIALRLGAPVCSPHVSTGSHRLGSRKSLARLSRHSAVNDLDKRALLSAEIPSQLEPWSLVQQAACRLMVRL